MNAPTAHHMRALAGETPERTQRSSWEQEVRRTLRAAADQADAVQAELWDEWWNNHAEHCSPNWPHEGNAKCYWEQPSTLAIDAADRQRIEDTKR